MQPWRVFIVVFVLAHVLMVTDGIVVPVGLVGLGVAGLAGLKLYYGMRLFRPAIRSARYGFHSHMSRQHLPPPAFRTDRVDPMLAGDNRAGSPMRQVVVLPIAFNPKDTHRGVPVSIRVRRDTSGGIQLSNGFLNWLKAIDDEKCLHRFLCELGSDQNRFGNLGRITNMLIMMGGLPDGSWAQDMYSAGQDGKRCPVGCDERELSKTVSYLERHIFVPYETKPGNELS